MASDERDEMTNVDARLMEMLSASRADENMSDEDRRTRRPDLESDYARSIGATVHEVPAGRRVPEASRGSDAWCRENPHLCYGRGPTGRLRNFRAMNDTKLRDTFWAVEAERNDPTALEAIRAEMNERGLL